MKIYVLTVQCVPVTGIHSFIYSAFQRSTTVDIELVIIIIIGMVQNDS